MNKKIVFRNMDHSDALEAHAHHQLERIVHFLENEPTPTTIDLFLEPSKVHAHHRVELRVKTPSYNKSVDYEGTDFYDVLNRVTDVMFKELCEAKDKRKDHLKSIGRHDDFKKQR